MMILKMHIAAIIIAITCVWFFSWIGIALATYLISGKADWRCFKALL